MAVTLPHRRRRPVAAAVALSAATLSAALAVVMTPAAASQVHDEGTGAVTAAENTRSADRTAVPAAKLMQAQRPLVEAANTIRDEVERRGYAAHYAGVVLRGTEGVDVYWKGAVPVPLRQVVDQASRTTDVRVRSAAYSTAELRSASARIEANWPGDRADLYGIMAEPDSSGLIVSASASVTAGRAAWLRDFGVPVKVVDEGPTVPIANRGNDTHPWSGGARIKVNENWLCTSGFGVRNPAGARYLLTAAHCGRIDSVVKAGNDSFIGNVRQAHYTHDVALVATSNVYPYIYSGCYNCPDSRSVLGWGHTFLGEYLCHSGHITAIDRADELCDFVVTGFRTDSYGLVEATQRQGIQAVRGGDSGAPVYSICCDNSGGVTAKGIATESIPGKPAAFLFQDFATAHQDFGGIVPVP